MGRGASPQTSNPSKVFLQAGEEALGVGPFKKEGNGLTPPRGHSLRGHQRARRLSGLKGPGLGRVRGAQGVLAQDRARGFGGPQAPEIGLGKLSSRGYLALPPAPAPRGLGRRQEEKRGLASGVGAAATPGAGRGERGGCGGERRGGQRDGSRGPGAALPAPRPPPRPAPGRPASRSGRRGPGLTFLLLGSLLFWKGGEGVRAAGASGSGGGPGRRSAGSDPEGRRPGRLHPLPGRAPGSARPPTPRAGPVPTHLRAAPWAHGGGGRKEGRVRRMGGGVSTSPGPRAPAGITHSSYSCSSASDILLRPKDRGEHAA